MKVVIDIIKGCRALGTSVKELQEIFKERDTDKLLEFLQIKKCEAQENINKMKDVIKNIDYLNKSVEYSKDISSNDDIEIKFFEKRYIITSPCREAGSLKELLYYSDLEKIFENKNLKMSMERGIIYKFNSDNSIKPRYVFSEFEGNINIEDKNNIKVLPRGNYLTLSYSKENEDERRKKIINYLKENNLKVKNIIEVELFNDFFNIESYNCQVQIFIEDK